MKLASRDTRASEIQGLRTRWEQISRRHVPTALGCLCGAPSAHVTAWDFESDLLAFLEYRYPAIQPPAPSHAGAATLPRYLDWLSTAELPPESVEGVICDVKKAFASFAPTPTLKAEEAFPERTG